MGEPGSLVGIHCRPWRRLALAPIVAIPLFVVSLAVTLAAARLFARRLDRLGSRFGFPETLTGLLTALAADGPEISSALVALAKGAHAAGVGVLVGSNAFNLAAMLGVSGLLAGSVCLTRRTLLLEGSVGMAVTAIGAAVLLGWVPPLAGALLAGAIAIPYVALVTGGGGLIARRRDPARDRRDHTPWENPTHHLLGLIVLDVAAIVAGSFGMVQAALALGSRWHVSGAALGVLVLAPLTSIPNAITAIRLGRAGRGTALVSETFNSNTINLGAGVIVPSLFVALSSTTATAKLQLAWLGGMTALCVLALARKAGIRRPQAAALVLLYGGFVAVQLAGG